MRAGQDTFDICDLLNADKAGFVSITPICQWQEGSVWSHTKVFKSEMIK